MCQAVTDRVSLARIADLDLALNLAFISLASSCKLPIDNPLRPNFRLHKDHKYKE